MDRLLVMDKEQFIAEMLTEARRAFGEVADAVNNAPDGHVINGSEVQVRDVMVELQRKAFQKAVQMRIDSTESSFSPSQGRDGPVQAQQGAVGAQQPEHQRSDRDAAKTVTRRRRGK